MCQQTKVLEKIHKKGAVNGYALELAEAQAMDYVTMNKKVEKIEKDVSSIKKEQARQGGQLDLVVQYINSPAEEERKDGIFWSELKSIGKTTVGKIIILLIIGCIALAGQRILELIGLIQ